MLKTTLYRTTTRTNHVTGHGVEGVDSYFQPEGKREQLAINLQESKQSERAAATVRFPRPPRSDKNTTGRSGPVCTCDTLSHRYRWITCHTCLNINHSFHVLFYYFLRQKPVKIKETCVTVHFRRWQLSPHHLTSCRAAHFRLRFAATPLCQFVNSAINRFL